MKSLLTRYLLPATAVLLGLVCAGPAGAADGPVLITQTSALAGNVTPGDAPGFPVTLSLPGSYKLASNLSVTSGIRRNGIEIDAINITIDLNGFVISGASYNGILARHGGLVVKNGTITGNETGIRAANRSILTVDHMIIRDNSGTNSGGSIVSYPGPILITDSIITDRHGDVIIGDQGDVGRDRCLVRSSIILGNTCKEPALDR